jgi:DNA mismatch repair protein
MNKVKPLPYDEADPYSIEEYSKKLIGKSFRSIIQSNEGTDRNNIIKDPGPTYDTKENLKLKKIENNDVSNMNNANKGALGQILEECHFYYKINSDNEPDFKAAGVELKATPMRKNKNGSYSAKERLVLNVINFMEIHKELFEQSSFLKKNKLLLLINYLYEEGIDRLDYIIRFVQLFEFPDKDLKIIEDDWNRIVNKIKEGKAHEISEGDTNYLGACTKGATKETKRIQPFNEIMAPQRAFCLKQSYMTAILNEYIIKGKKTYIESLVKNLNELKEKTFESFILEKIDKYSGKTVEELAGLFSIKANPTAKNYASIITDKIRLNILGVQSDKIEEFNKANIRIKTIRVNSNNTINESMSFPTFKFTEIIKEEWETSTLRETFLNIRFLFVIFRYNENNELRLDRGMFWNMPYQDLEDDVKSVWKKTVSTIKDGIRIIKTVGNRDYNNLPNSNENRVAHVRPHGSNKKDTYPLPTGGEFTKQCFWLNNSYLMEQIAKKS